LIGHELHTPNAKSVVKQSRFCGSFSLSLAVNAQYHARLTPTSMTKSSPPPVARAFTLIELLIVIAMITLLAALAVPAFNKVFESAKATKDTSNLRQIGAATQMYMNDNNNVFPGSATQTWMSQLEPKYLSSWRVLESPFDKRSTSESGGAAAMVSYGINASILPSNVPISGDKITKPVTFIVFAPAQAATPSVTFAGTGNPTGFPGVKVLAALSTPPGQNAQGGTHANRRKISAICADWHAEIMPWSGTGPAFINQTYQATDPDAGFRWSPQGP
jgi:prepilin-type N-terminal cleavage/methylation domain-containing protein